MLEAAVCNTHLLTISNIIIRLVAPPLGPATDLKRLSANGLKIGHNSALLPHVTNGRTILKIASYYRYPGSLVAINTVT